MTDVWPLRFAVMHNPHGRSGHSPRARSPLRAATQNCFNRFIFHIIFGENQMRQTALPGYRRGDNRGIMLHRSMNARDAPPRVT